MTCESSFTCGEEGQETKRTCRACYDSFEASARICRACHDVDVQGEARFWRQLRVLQIVLTCLSVPFAGAWLWLALAGSPAATWIGGALANTGVPARQSPVHLAEGAAALASR